MSATKAYYHKKIEAGLRSTSLSVFNGFAATETNPVVTYNIDRENGAIYNISVCTIGPALGHGVELDAAFIAEVERMGNASMRTLRNGVGEEYTAGIKARFGHPSMSTEALGTYVGEFINFRTKDKQVFADFYTNGAADAKAVENIFQLAEHAPHAFGTSIVFEALPPEYHGDDGKIYEYDDWDYIYIDEEGNQKPESVKIIARFARIKELHGNDFVDEPAANKGLFGVSSAEFNPKSFAVIGTQFAAQHPKIVEFLKANPQKLIKFLSQIGIIIEMSKPKRKFRQKQYDIPATTTDGKEIIIVTESDEPMVGDAVTDTEDNPLPNSTVTIADGEMADTVITVVDGAITEITKPATSDPGEQPIVAEMAEKLAALTKEVEEMRKSAPQHTPDNRDGNGGEAPKSWRNEASKAEYNK